MMRIAEIVTCRAGQHSWTQGARSKRASSPVEWCSTAARKQRGWRCQSGYRWQFRATGCLWRSAAERLLEGIGLQTEGCSCYAAKVIGSVSCSLSGSWGRSKRFRAVGIGLQTRVRLLYFGSSVWRQVSE